MGTPVTEKSLLPKMSDFCLFGGRSQEALQLHINWAPRRTCSVEYWNIYQLIMIDTVARADVGTSGTLQRDSAFAPAVSSVESEVFKLEKCKSNPDTCDSYYEGHF